VGLAACWTGLALCGVAMFIAGVAALRSKGDKTTTERVVMRCVGVACMLAGAGIASMALVATARSLPSF
jgi:hypothetical protein